ncbi:MAG: hypothetical protein ACOYBY_13040 [Dermatophilaceae bacterium]
MNASVVTRSYDNARTGATNAEPGLTADAVRTRGIKRLFSLAIPGDICGVEAQPLIMPGVRMGDGTVHNLVILADMANQVWGFDADNGQRLWRTTLGTPVKGSREIDWHLVNDHWGVLSTPVIDSRTSTVYVVAWASPDASVAKATFSLHALRLADGGHVQPPLDLMSATFSAGHGQPPRAFGGAARKQRAALLLTDINGVSTVFIGFGSVAETGNDARGWVLACSTQPLALTTAWASTAHGQGGGIWHAGGGLAADAAGAIYAMTGNGDFDGGVQIPV